MKESNFNCADQTCWSWIQRAEVCVELIAKMFNGNELGSVADLGCGDQKLRLLLNQRGIGCSYQGYDLLPQSPEVIRFDAHIDTLPSGIALVVMLGVIEYLRNLPAVFQSLARQAPFLILSHVIRQGAEYNEERLKELGWRNHLSQDDLLGCLRGAQYEVVEQRMDKEGKTILVGCRSRNYSVKPAS